MSLMNIFKTEEETKKPTKSGGVKSARKKPAAKKEEIDLKKIEEEIDYGSAPAAKESGKVSKAGQYAYKVLIKPLITEKSAVLSAENKYVFAVAVSTSKAEVAKAVAAIYKVTPVAVNIIKNKGKNVRFGKNLGRTKDWKKAIVTVKTGDKIEFYHQNA